MRLMRILIKDSLGNLQLIGKFGLRAPIIGLVVDKRLNTELSEKVGLFRNCQILIVAMPTRCRLRRKPLLLGPYKGP